MRNIWIISRHEYLKNVKRVGFLVFTFSVPAVQLFIILISSLGTDTVGNAVGGVLENLFLPEDTVDEVAVVDQNGQFTPLLPTYTHIFQLYDTPETGRDAVQNGEADTLLIIPESYSADQPNVTIIGQEDASLTEMLPESQLLESFFLDHLLRETPIDTEIRSLMTDPYDVDLATLVEEEEAETNEIGQEIANPFIPFFAGILLVTTISLTSGYLLQGVSKDKSSRIVEILLSSVTSRDLLAGKVLGMATLGLTQMSVWIGTTLAISYGLTAQSGIAPYIIGALFNRTDFLIFGGVYYLLGFLVYASLYGAAGALGTSPQEAQQLAGLFALTASSPLILAGFLILNPNGLLPRILSFFPLTAATMMLIRLPLANVPTIDIVVSITSLALTIPVIIWIGARLFRLGLLMYTQRPTLRQMWRALRQS